jgi:hypothetical protein
VDFLFVATLEEVRSSASRDVELAEFPYAETFPAAVRRHLYVAVSGVDVAASAESLTLQSPDGDGSFVNQVAGPVVTALASLTDEALPGLAATVAATAEAKAALRWRWSPRRATSPAWPRGPVCSSSPRAEPRASPRRWIR